MLKFVFLIACLFFTSCSTQSVTETNTVSHSEFTPYIINLESVRTRSVGEKEKCMSGVYLDGEFAFKGINDFEEKTNSNNDIYIKRITNDEDFPASFIIDCISKGKTPMLIVESNVKDIENIAKKCSSLSVNMFVSFDYGMNCEMYNQSAAIFREYAPSAILMWNIAFDYDITACPNEEYVDWINLTFNEEILNDNICTRIEELRNVIKYFSNKAVAINVSVENFSGKTHKYYTDLWLDEVNSIYRLSEDYENIALINYMHNSESNRIYGSSRLSESRLIWQEFGNITKNLADKRQWNSTNVVAYVSNNTAYVKYSDAKLLNIDEKYVNNKYAAVKNYALDNINRKMFVYSNKM